MKATQKWISPQLVTLIKKVQKEEQINLYIKKGRNAKSLSFQDASHIFARRNSK